MQYRRAHITDSEERVNFGNRSHKQYGTTISQQPRTPFAVLAQNFDNNLPDQHHVCDAKFSSYGNVSKIELLVMDGYTWNLKTKTVHH